KFNQTGTGTGRLSSSEPNLQNIPIQTEDGRQVRKAFIAAPGNCLISADYSQIELRLLAHMGGDASLIQAFLDDQDIHSATAREILNIDPQRDVSTHERRIGKTLNFGIIYGMSGFRLGRELGIPVGVANEYIDDYFNKYSGVRAYFDSLEHSAEQDGFVRTLFGRKRIITAIDSGDRGQGYLRRVAINAPIQGSAADIVKLAMIRVHEALLREGLPVKMLLQIHDELIFEVNEGAKELALTLVKNEMEAVADLKVPLKVEIAAGASWYEVH
ncbi:MAG: DNA polymerase I, partial [Bdellovibrionales bacterium]|nr:DNA polymerase I [Bdellovibrionales bacterium]